ncbi:MAG: heme exporter protein CcmD [Pseudomonadota bacterium]
MPDLGLYTGEVLAAYAGSLALLAVLVGGSIWQARRVRRRLEAMERARREASQSHGG